MHSRLLFAAIYIAVDLLYVYSSKEFYDAAVSRITGVQKAATSKSNSKPLVIPVAILTYAIMAAGWYFLVAPVAEKANNTKATILHAALVGLLMYGVFNGTLYVMFDNWSSGVALRDLTWGVFWITSLSLIYAAART